ncbi:hypothetical protein PR048_028783, partial [Dryococelus australis]
MGFDGASNMSGQFNGCATKMKEIYPQAMYVHCVNHSFNLALSHVCTVSTIRNCISTINSIITFFRASPEDKRTRLIEFCETQWVERLDAIALVD